MRFNLKDTCKHIVFSSFPDGGGSSVGFRMTDSSKYAVYESFPREVLASMLRKSQRDEEMMLLYVALTRAKYRLFITRRNDSEPVSSKVTVGDKRAELASLIENGDCTAAVSEGMNMESWLDIALSLFDETDDDAVKALGDCYVRFTDGRLNDDESVSEAQSDESEAVPDEEKARIFNENISDSYDYTQSVTASKLTVSEIAKKHEPKLYKVFAQKPAAKKASGKKAPLSAAERGTAVHAFMQLCDLKKLCAVSPESRSEAIAAEAQRLVRCGHITEIQSRCADPEIIGKFLDSELCKRIIRSDNVMKEKKFLIKISDLCIDKEILDNSCLKDYNNTEGMLQGVADLVFEENGSLVLVDYKTDRNVTPQLLRERYSFQLYLYARAVSLIFGKPVSQAYLYSFDMGEVIETSLSPEDVTL